MTKYSICVYKIFNKIFKETGMKGIWVKLMLLASGLLALIGINTPSVQANTHHNKQIAEVRNTTPVYLKLGIDISPQVNKNKHNIKVTQHFSHQSHRSHYSHYSSRF